MRLTLSLFVAALCLSILSTNAQSYAIQKELPLEIPGKFVEPLVNTVDYNLQRSLIQKLSQNQKWRSLISQKKLAVGLVDLSDPYNVKYASVNGQEMMYAASLPKIAVLLASADALDKGELPETKEILHDMRLMIAKSDNQATTRMIDRLGYKKIEKILTDPRYELYNKNDGGGIWVGKRYAASGARHPDPLKGLSHAATVEQVCRFYYMLAFGQLVNYHRSAQMLEMMVDPELHHKFVNTLDKVAPDAKIYRKSGSWKNFHADSVMVMGPEWRNYILVALSEDAEGEMIMRQLVTSVEEVLQENMPYATKR